MPYDTLPSLTYSTFHVIFGANVTADKERINEFEDWSIEIIKIECQN